MTSVLVTGADGFIGSHLVELLVARGYDVRAFVQYNSLGTRGWLDAVPTECSRRIAVVSGDVRDSTVVEAALEGMDAVLHLAALIAIPYSYQAPRSYLETNAMGTLNILEGARRHGTTRVVVTSTSEVYGTAQFVPITEEHPLNAQSPYAASKIAADQLSLSFAAAFDLPVSVVRPFNTYGPRQSARAVIPSIITQLASQSGRLRLGSLYPTRDFMFVEDTAAAFAATLESPAAIGEVLNFGTGYEVSIGQTLEIIADVMGVDADLEVDEARQRPSASEVERLVADAQKSERLLGWSPAFSGPEGFRRGLEITINWFRDPSNLNRYRASEYGV